ncbi:MAG: HNH endonuclease signature motif containing protein [bacterium]
MPYKLQSGYIQLNDKVNRKKYEHRVVWEKNYGKIPQGYEIHHINGKKDDNRIENLEIMLSSEHKSKHSRFRSEESRKIMQKIAKEMWATGKMDWMKERKGEKHPCWRKLPIKEILSLYKKGLSPNKIEKLLNINKRTIQKRLNLYAGCNYAV